MEIDFLAIFTLKTVNKYGHLGQKYHLFYEDTHISLFYKQTVYVICMLVLNAVLTTDFHRIHLKC